MSTHVTSRLALLLCLLASAALAAPEPDAAKPPPPKNLLAGATWEYSTNNGKTFSQTPPAPLPQSATNKVNVLARITFTTKQQPKNEKPFVCLQLHNAASPNVTSPKYRLNNAPLFGPLPRVHYRDIPAIPATYLAKKPPFTNTLTATYPLLPGRKTTIQPALLGMRPAHLTFDITPIVGSFGPDHLMLAARTNIPATITLRSAGWQDKPGTNVTFLQWKGGAKLESPIGLFHRFFIRKPKTINAITYRLTAECEGHTVHFPPKGEQTVLLPRHNAGESKTNPLRFVITGDSRTQPKQWQRVAKAVHAAKPSFMILVGDYLTSGLDDRQWVEEFSKPAQALLASTPSFPVIGNHEENSPLYFKLFTLPKGRTPKPYNDATFSHVVGPIQIIGLNGLDDYTPGSAYYKWLELKLADSTAKFLFVVNHYPAYSSSNHGRLRPDGLPKERAARQARQHILPLLKKYNASAYIAGHDHIYERTSLPGNPPQLTVGGGGAPLRQKTKTAQAQNPYSTVFASEYHYALAEVAGKTCTIQVRTPEGKTLDTLVLKARN